MRKLTSGLLLSFALLFAAHLSFAQLTSTGGGKKANPVAAFSGAGDIVSGAYGYWGLDCYTSAYTGNVADIYAPADATHTLLTCSTGGVINETLQALSTTCAVSCTVKTLYDQSGANSCTRGAGPTDCAAEQATEASRPTYNISGCTGSTKNCMACSGTQGLSTPSQQSTEAQPYTVSAVANRNAATTSFGMIFAMSDFSFQVGWANSTNTLFNYAGGVANATAADSSFHSLQYVLNGASSDTNVDGTPNTGSAGTNGITGVFLGICSPAGNSFTGQFREVGLWLSAFNTTQSSQMSTNQHTRGGF